MSAIMQHLKSISWKQLVVITLMVMVAVSFDACKSSGKLSRKEKKAQIEMYKKELRNIIKGTTTLSLDEQEALISEAINKNFNDSQLNDLIQQAQQKTKSLQAQKQKLLEQKIAAARNKLYDLLVNKQNLSADELERELNKIKAENFSDSEIDELIARLEKKISDLRQYATVEKTLKSRLEEAFQKIATSAASGDLQTSNNLIKSTLNYFSAFDVPVLIIISREGDVVDYDKPTTIINYLNFLKDQKQNRNNVDSYEVDTSGKIKEIELIKK